MTNVQRQLKSRTTILALTASFAALYAILRLIPVNPMIGMIGNFPVSDYVAPLWGLVLGPYIGPISIVLGTFISIFLGRPSFFFGLDFLPAAMDALIVGLIVKRRFSYAIIIYIILLILFIANPITLIFVELNNVFVPYNWLHIIGLIVLISPLSRKALKWIHSPIPHTTNYNFKLQKIANFVLKTRGMLILCFIGSLSQHLTGGMLFSLMGLMGMITMESWPVIWTSIFYIYPIERTLMTIVAAIVGSTSFRILNKWLNQVGINN